MISVAPTRFAPISILSPTPPRPTIATELPAGTFAVFTTAPTPVRTAQPNSAASWAGNGESPLMPDGGDTTADSPYRDPPMGGYKGASPRRNRLAQESKVPATLERAPGSQKAGRPSRQGIQLPQEGMK